MLGSGRYVLLWVIRYSSVGVGVVVYMAHGFLKYTYLSIYLLGVVVDEIKQKMQKEMLLMQRKKILVKMRRNKIVKYDD